MENKITRIIVENEKQGRIYQGISVDIAQQMFRTFIPADQAAEFNQSFPGVTYDTITPEQDRQENRKGIVGLVVISFLLGALVSSVVFVAIGFLK